MASNWQQASFTTLPEMLDYIGQNYGETQFLRYKEADKWQEITTAVFLGNIKKLALALHDIGLESGQSLAIFADPAPLWLTVDFATIIAGGVSVPIFANVAADNLLFELENSSSSLVFCSSADNLQLLLQLNFPFRKIITSGFTTQQKSSGPEIISLESLLEKGAKLERVQPNLYSTLSSAVKPHALAAIIYTSGSTGRPKGVEITNHNLIEQIKGAAQLYPLDPALDVALSFLPLAHIFERMVVTYYLAAGISICFGEVKNLGGVVKEVQPTLMTVVPRMLEKLYGQIKIKAEQEKGRLRKAILQYALKRALAHEPDKSGGLLDLVLDRLVYQKIRAKLGGKLRMMICGGAALSIELQRFYNNIGIPLYVGYGLTETSPVVAANFKGASKMGYVGRPFPQVKVKLAPDKELLALGPNIMKGYHLDEAQTKETIDAAGWLKTGDLAEIDSEGYIKIIGRKKELFKTANGKYVNPVIIEQKLLKACGFLTAVAVIAEGRRFVSCLLFPDFEVLPAYKAQFGLESLSDAQFLEASQVKHKLDEAIAKLNQGLNHWEQIQKYYLVNKSLSVEGGELTPSLKLRRQVIEQEFAEVIEGFYKED